MMAFSRVLFDYTMNTYFVNTIISISFYGTSNLFNMTYVDVSKETGRRSNAWKHFLLNKDNEKAKCKISGCEKILDAKGGSTRGLLQHLKVFHECSTKH